MGCNEALEIAVELVKMVAEVRDLVGKEPDLSAQRHLVAFRNEEGFLRTDFLHALAGRWM